MKHDNQSQVGSISADRWLEIDLYWFEKTDIIASVDFFWNRYAPLFRGVNGEKGIILNVGWLMDYILEWTGDLNDRLRLPAQMKAEKYTDYTPLAGTTEQRIEGWKKRFASVHLQAVNYENWTYGDLKFLVETLRKGAAHHRFPEMRIGTFTLGWRDIYGGQHSTWAGKQPQVYNPHRPFAPFNVEAKLNADPTAYAAFSKGIPAGIPVYEFFAAQWGNLSQQLNLDAFVLRDSMVGMGVYRRNRGPYGTAAPADPAAVESYSRANANLVNAMKLANPKVWLMGYSSGACAVADWRINCVDLESLAKEGYLDAYIDQTWSGAWNEVGQRSYGFWNEPNNGWTAQLAYVLLHSAVLADTKVKHYTCAGTFDPWEPWDAIHTAPDRLRWGIWAYLHAGVKTPAGLKFPNGSYIAWGNQGKDLLTENDVQFLAKNINEAAMDASQTKEIFGPTLVYTRSAMEWQSKNAPAISIKEWIDEQAAIVMKGSVPILSVTRLEYLPQVTSDLFIVQTPVHLQPAEKETLLALIRSGQPVAIWGSPAGGIDPEVAAATGLISTDVQSDPVKESARLGLMDLELSPDIPPEFKLYHPWSRNQASPGTQVVYSVDRSPALILNRANGMNVLTWDPCEYALNVSLTKTVPTDSLEEILGSFYPYVMVSRALTQMLREKHRLFGTGNSVLRPVTVHAWRLTDGAIRILVADTEEGLDHSAETAREVTLTLPAGWPATFTELRGTGTISAVDGKLRIQLQKSEDRLYGATPKL